MKPSVESEFFEKRWHLMKMNEASSPDVILLEAITRIVPEENSFEMLQRNINSFWDVDAIAKNYLERCSENKMFLNFLSGCFCLFQRPNTEKHWEKYYSDTDYNFDKNVIDRRRYP